MMKYLSVKEIAALWNTSERSVRNYCAAGRVPGAFLTGKTWNIPENAEKPERSNKSKPAPQTLADILKEEKRSRLPRKPHKKATGSGSFGAGGFCVCRP